MASPRRITHAERIRRNVAVTPDGCWIWLGATNPAGYGTASIPRDYDVDYRKRCSVLVHRLSYKTFRGSVPEGLVLDHVVCDERVCVNPWHVEPRTISQNTLRGNSPPAINARKTHCPNGHELTGEHLYVRPDANGKQRRACRTCRNEYSRARRLAARSAA